MSSINRKNIEIKVQFEFVNDKDVLDLSKEYKVKISLDEKTDFEANKKKILSQANFKTEKFRNNYHMFNKKQKKFLIQNSDFESYIKTKSPIILINSYEYSDKTIKKLNEEIDLVKNKSINEHVNEMKKGELINLLSCLENNLEVDIFADEFIFKKGMDILLCLIKDYCGDIRHYSLKGINKLLSFESAIDFFTKDENNLNTLFVAFIGNNELNNEFVFLDAILKLISAKENIIPTLIDMCDNYFFKKTINFLDENSEDNNLKTYILFFINTILNFVDENKQSELIIEITNAGIFDNLAKIKNIEEDSLIEQIELFEFTVKKFIEKNDDNNYKDIKIKFNNYIEEQKVYKIQNLIFKTNSEDEDIKVEAINELNNLLTENNNLDLIYTAYMKNLNTDKMNLFYLYFIQLFELDENNIIKFIKSATKYSENIKSKPFNELFQILNNSKPPSLQLKLDTFSFINKALIITSNFSNNQTFLELLYLLTENRIFEFSEKSDIEEILKTEVSKFKEIINNNISKVEQSSEQKYKLIKDKLKAIKEKKIFNQINELFLQVHNSSSKNHMINAKKLVDMLEDDNNFKIFFKMFAENDVKNLYFSFYEIFTQYCVERDELCMKLIQAVDDYKKEHKINCFSMMINYLDEYQNELVQVKALKLVNTLLSVKDKKFAFTTLNKFNKLGIFENLNNLIKVKEKEEPARIQLGLFLAFTKEILKNNKKGENYEEINKKYKNLEKTKDLFDKSLDQFIV